MKKQVSLFFYLILLFTLSTCTGEQMDDCITSAGKKRTEMRYLANFTDIVAGNYFDIYLKQDLTQPPYIKITAGSNLLGQIITDVDRNVLYLDNQNVCNWVRSFQNRIPVEINVHTLGMIHTTEDAAVTGSDSLAQGVVTLLNESSNDMYVFGSFDYLIVNQKLQGDVAADGTANIVIINQEGVGKTNLQGLLGAYVFVNHYGKNDIKVDARKGLEVYIYNSGNVYYFNHEPIEFKKLARLGTGYCLRR
ncbi:MAG: DUF2807 domain-containing protein [Bacteroidia bacterium]|nr:DUF2807 domain-containing protein [Bacteroidia bacterium]